MNIDPRAELIGEHLTGEPRLPDFPGKGKAAQQPQPAKEGAGVPQIFSGSSDEWTDQRIREFQEKMEQSRLGIPRKTTAEEDAKGADKDNHMIQYETFESSSEGEMSRCIFESQALSFQNKDKVVSSREKEQRRLDRLKRKERKVNEKLK